MRRLGDVTEGEPQIQEMGGLAFWFALPDRPARQTAPRVKMALLTWLGVYPLSLLFPALVTPWIPTWPLWIRALISAGLIVVSLTWFVMPNFTRLFGQWLFASQKRS